MLNSQPVLLLGEFVGSGGSVLRGGLGGEATSAGLSDVRPGEEVFVSPFSGGRHVDGKGFWREPSGADEVQQGDGHKDDDNEDGNGF